MKQCIFRLRTAWFYICLFCLFTVVAQLSADPALKSVYRWRNDTRQDHALSIVWTPTTPPAPGEGYVLEREEGVLFSPSLPQPPGTVPLHIWYSDDRKDYFSSTEPVWRGGPGETRSPGYVWVMLQGFVFDHEVPGTVPLYHWFNAVTGDNLESTETRWSNAGVSPREGYEAGNIQGYIYAPARWDLSRYQSAFKYQGDRGGCTMFSVTAALEAAGKHAYELAGHDISGYELDLSEEFLNYAQKMFKLNSIFDATASPRIAEYFLGPTDGGLGLENLRVLALNQLRLPLETAMPFHSKYYQIPAWIPWLPADLDFIPELDFSKPMFANDQKMTDTVNLNPRLLPVSALARSSFYGVGGFEAISANDPGAIEAALTAGHEVILDVGLIGDTWLRGGNPLPSYGGAGHSMLVIGYDRTDVANPYFVLKNSWGPTAVEGWDGFQHVSYEFIRRAAFAAGCITSVSGPTAWPELQFLGRWNLDFDGWQGTLDIYHLEGMANQQLMDAGLASADRRLGTFFDTAGNAFRVNGSVRGSWISFWIDGDRPNPGTDGLAGRHFNYCLFRNGDQTEMAGFHSDPDGRTWGGYARKEHSFLSGIVPAGSLQPSTYFGAWRVNFDGIVGRMEMRTRDDAGSAPGWAGLLGTITYTVGGVDYTKDVRLAVAISSPSEIQLRIPWPDGREYRFNGKMLSWNQGVIAGEGTDPASTAAGFYANRIGEIAGPALGRLEFHQGTYRVDESVGGVVITVDRLLDLRGSVVVRYRANNASAIAPDDFGVVTGIIEFAEGESQQQFTVPIVNDTLHEALETIELVLTDPSSGAALGAASRADLQIVDDDPMPAVMVQSVSVAEGDNASTFVDVPVVLTAPSGEPVTVSISTRNGTAIAGADYRAVDATLLFRPGETLVTYRLEILPDLVQEDDETFFVQINSVTGATLAASTASVVIHDNDPMPTITVDDLILTEGDDGIQFPTFTVRLSAPSTRTVRLQAVTADGTAIAGEDYLGISVPRVEFEPGQTMALIQVAITGRPGPEPDETFYLRPFNPVNGILARTEAVGTIKELRFLSIRHEGSDIVLRFPTGNAGQSYHIERTMHLDADSPSWAEITPGSGIPGTGEILEFRDHDTINRELGLYRIRQTTP